MPPQERPSPTFYSKRSKVMVTLHQTVDDLPAWSADELGGYGDALFRDVLAYFDRRDHRIIVALGHGKSVSEIAGELGHKGGAAVSILGRQLRWNARSPTGREPYQRTVATGHP
jgi:hypothetical protein